MQILGALRAPHGRLILDHLVPLRFSLSSPLLPATPHHSFVCGDPPSVTWLQHPTEGCDSGSRSLWLFAAHASSTMACLMHSPHPSLYSLTSALICAVLQTSLESPAAGCIREYASCAFVKRLCALLANLLFTTVFRCKLFCLLFSSAGLCHGVVR